MTDRQALTDALAAALRTITVPETYEEWQARVDASYEGDATAIRIRYCEISHGDVIEVSYHYPE